MLSYNKNRLYNVIIPVWLLWLLPQVWVVVLPANLLIDFLVILITFKALKVEDIKSNVLKCVFLTWLFGFISDAIGAALLLLPTLLSNGADNTPFMSWVDDNITAPVFMNPFSSVYSIIWVLLAVGLGAGFIYLFNYKVCLKKTTLTDTQKKRTALMLAVCTAPYLFFLPTEWFI